MKRTLWFLLAVLLVVQVSCQELTIDACTRNEVTFTCTIRGSKNLITLILAWSSTEYIGQGDPLRFTTQDIPRAIDITSMINGNVTATLTRNTNINGVPVLVSELRIVGADQSSVITCTSESQGTSESTQFDSTSSDVPGKPQDIVARELAAGDCGFLVTWNSPTNIDRFDIDRYIIYVPSQNFMKNSSSSTIDFTIPNCRSDDSIQVAAVNQLGCIGPYSPPIQPILVETPTIATQHDDNKPSSISISAIVISVITILVVVIFLHIFYWKVKKLITRKNDQDSEAAKHLLKKNESPTDTPLKEMDSNECIAEVPSEDTPKDTSSEPGGELPTN